MSENLTVLKETQVVVEDVSDGENDAAKVLVEDVNDSDNDKDIENETDKKVDNLDSQEDEENKITDKFEKIIKDFINDLKTSFPEFNNIFSNYYNEDGSLKLEMLYDYCKKNYPERFFDFLYKNDEIITDESRVIEILPSLNLKMIWDVEGITDSIKDTIWKYLQLILFSVVGDVNDKNIFGNTAKIFETIDEKELQNKMEDTMKDLFKLFQDNENQESDDNENSENVETPEFLNPENMQEHISSLLGGKLGQLATEIAEETAKEFEVDMEGATNSEDVMKKLLSNPNKLMNLVKKVGGKLDNKIKSGDIDEKELMKEAGDLMKKMKGMPGMGNINDILKKAGASRGQMDDILKKMGMPNPGKNARVNMGAYNNMMRKQEAIDKARQQAQAQAKKRREEKRLKEEMEERKKNHVAPTNEDIELLMKELNLDDDETKTTVNNTGAKKKKKKKNKK